MVGAATKNNHQQPWNSKCKKGHKSIRKLLDRCNMLSIKHGTAPFILSKCQSNSGMEPKRQGTRVSQRHFLTWEGDSLPDGTQRATTWGHQVAMGSQRSPERTPVPPSGIGTDASRGQCGGPIGILPTIHLSFLHSCHHSAHFGGFYHVLYLWIWCLRLIWWYLMGSFYSHERRRVVSSWARRLAISPDSAVAMKSNWQHLVPMTI